MPHGSQIHSERRATSTSLPSPTARPPPSLRYFGNICAQPVADDGLRFDTGNVLVEPSSGDRIRRALRVRTSAQLASAIIKVQIDVGLETP